MESTTKKVILPTKGICNASPDKICDDTELLDSVGLTYFNDALRPIQKTKAIKSLSNGTLMYVHRLNDGITVNYITADGASLYCNNLTIKTFTSTILNVTAVSNTLIVNIKDYGLYYIRWTGSSYSAIGSQIPEPDVRFQLTDHATGGFLDDADNYYHSYVRYYKTDDKTKTIACACGTVYDILTLHIKVGSGITDIDISDQTAFNNLINGLYGTNRNKIHKKGGFINPFLACYALELYDGSYYMVSNPVLMYPSLTLNSHCRVSHNDEDGIEMITTYAKLNYKSLISFSGWEDIVKNISIFVSQEIDIYDLSADAVINAIYPSKSTEYYLTYNIGDRISPGYISENDTFDAIDSCVIRPFTNISSESFKKNLADKALFYKVAEISAFSSQTSWTSLSDKIEGSTLDNLTTQPYLDKIDFYQHCAIRPSFIETFNYRLNAANIIRGFFNGFEEFMPYTYNNGGSSSLHQYKIAVVIKTTDGDKTVVNSFSSYDIIGNHCWFFYPDPRAKKAIINGTELTLTEHTGLNGAYYFGGIPDGTETAFSGTTSQSESSDLYEYLSNYLLQSEVDNPFTFFASGYVRVGQGTIIGMAGLTTALSQDAYKISTTLVFTTQGIWAVTVDDAGQYKAVAPPFSREVCTNADSITMVDNAVYFVSDKGLMLITDDGIQCVSSHLAGKNPDSDVYSIILGTDTTYADFLTFLKDCKIAYDYRDSQLIITNSNFAYHWVYNIKTGTFSRFVDDTVYKAIVSDYPDTLLHDTNGVVHSLTNEPNINADTNKYSATLITRPMKFEESVKLKTIRELLHIDDLNDSATISIKIYGSNDCRTWQEIPSLHGRGFKFFIFRYDFTNLLAYDSFAGSIIGYDTRETDKLR